MRIAKLSFSGPSGRCSRHCCRQTDTLPSQTRSRHKRRLFSLPNHSARPPPADRRRHRHAVNLSVSTAARPVLRCDAHYFSAARFGHRIAANPLPVPLWAARIRKFSRPNRTRRQSGPAFQFVLTSCLLFHPIRQSDLAMAEATRSSIHWLVLAALCLSARTLVPAQSSPAQSGPTQSGPAQSPPQHSVQIQSPQSGSLAGRLTDLHSAPLAGVTLVLRNQATGAEIRTSTSRNGVFRFPSLDAASYTLDADAANLGHGRLEGIVVTGGTESRVQAAMAFDPAPPVLLQASAPPQISARPPPLPSCPALKCLRPPYPVLP